MIFEIVNVLVIQHSISQGYKFLDTRYHYFNVNFDHTLKNNFRDIDTHYTIPFVAYVRDIRVGMDCGRVVQ